MSLASCDYLRLLIPSADSLDPDQDSQIVGLNLNQNSDSVLKYFLKKILEKVKT